MGFGLWVMGSGRYYYRFYSVWVVSGLWPPVSPGRFFGNLLIVFHMQASHALHILLARLAMQIAAMRGVSWMAAWMAEQ